MSPIPRTSFVALLLLVAPLAACGSEDDGGAIAVPEGSSTTTTGAESTTTTATTAPPPGGSAITIAVEVAGGEPVGGAQQVDVAVGAEVTITVSADAPDEVHVHGYDLFADVTPESPASITFVADIPGQFEIELEGDHTLLVELTVA